MDLIIAEKKNVAEAISETFNISEKQNGYFKNDRYIVTWASGHLLENKQPEEMDIKYKEWSLDTLPIQIDENWEVRPKKYDLSKVTSELKTKLEYSQKSIDRQLSIIEKYLKNSEIENIIHCGDPDAEGQLLIDELITYYNCKKPVLRVLINDNNPTKIKEAFEKIKPNKEYINLGKSAFARSIADMYLGINATRFFSIKSGLKKQTLKIGRVKTPVIALVVNRYLEVKNHKKSYYYTLDVNCDIPKKTNSKEQEEYKKIVALYNQEFTNEEKRKKLIDKLCDEFEKLNEKVNLKFSLVPPKELTENGKIIDKSVLKNLQKEITGVHNLIVSKEIIKKEAPLPFNLIELQQYSNIKWGYSSDDVMNITQSLRDNYRAITYNRSDCQYLSEEHYKEAPTVIPQILQNLNIIVPDIDYNRKSKCFNDENVTAHHGIIPTNVKLDLTKLTDKERNIYTAISNFYIAQFLSPQISEKTTGEIKILEEILLRSTSSKILDYGFKSFLNDKEEETEKISELSSLYGGEYSSEIVDSIINTKETAPKKLYTEATLLKDMTSISKYVTDPKLKQALKDKDKDKKGENGGIGTPATRSTILAEIFNDKYFILQGKNIVPSEFCLKYYEYLPSELKKADITAQWWLIQEEIEKGLSEPRKLILNVSDNFLDIMSHDYEKIDYRENNAVKEKEVIGKCPKCQKNVYESKISYYCEGFRDNPKCNFSIWKENKVTNSKISETQAKNLLEGKTISIKGETYLLKNGLLKKEEKVIPCPRCKKSLSKTLKTYTCECGFTLWKNNKLLGELTEKECEKLLKEECIERYDLTNKEGKKYHAKFKLDDTGKFVNVKLVSFIKRGE